MGVTTSLWPSNTRSLMSLTASQMAAASAASFLPSLPERRLGDDELGRHQAHRVAEPLEFACPVVCATARFHANATRRQRGDEFEQLGTRHAGTQKYRLACGINAMYGKDILARLIPMVTMVDVDFPFQQTSELMRDRTSHRGTWMPCPATARLTRDGEVPFIR